MYSQSRGSVLLKSRKCFVDAPVSVLNDRQRLDSGTRKVSERTHKPYPVVIFTPSFTRCSPTCLFSGAPAYI